jgi:hypothetical protein
MNLPVICNLTVFYLTDYELSSDMFDDDDDEWDDLNDKVDQE